MPPFVSSRLRSPSIGLKATSVSTSLSAPQSLSYTNDIHHEVRLIFGLGPGPFRQCGPVADFERQAQASRRMRLSCYSRCQHQCVQLAHSARQQFLPCRDRGGRGEHDQPLEGASTEGCRHRIFRLDVSFHNYGSHYSGMAAED